MIRAEDARFAAFAATDRPDSPISESLAMAYKVIAEESRKGCLYVEIWADQFPVMSAGQKATFATTLRNQGYFVALAFRYSNNMPMHLISWEPNNPWT